MLVDAKPIVVGFSGGADSMMLLHLLHQMQLPVLAAHVHHGLRGVEADRDEKAAELFCEKFKIPLEILHKDTPMGKPIRDRYRRMRRQAPFFFSGIGRFKRRKNCYSDVVRCM